MNVLNEMDFYRKIELDNKLFSQLKKSKMLKIVKICCAAFWVIISMCIVFFINYDTFILINLVIALICWIINRLLKKKFYSSLYDNYNEQINKLIFDNIFSQYYWKENEPFPEVKFRDSKFWLNYKRYNSNIFLSSKILDKNLMFGQIKLEDWGAYSIQVEVPFEGLLVGLEDYAGTANGTILILSNSTAWEPRYKKVKNHYLKKRYTIFTDNIEQYNILITTAFLETISPYLRELKDKVSISIDNGNIYVEFYSQNMLKPKNINKIYSDYKNIIKIMEIIKLINRHL